MKRIAALLCVAALGAGTYLPPAVAQVKEDIPTVQQKRERKLTNKIRQLNQKVRMLREQRDHLQAVVQADVTQQVPALSADALWPVIERIGIRLADFPGYYVSVEEKIDDNGKYETFSFTQAEYFEMAVEVVTG